MVKCSWQAPGPLVAGMASRRTLDGQDPSRLRRSNSRSMRALQILTLVATTAVLSVLTVAVASPPIAAASSLGGVQSPQARASRAIREAQATIVELSEASRASESNGQQQELPRLPSVRTKQRKPYTGRLATIAANESLICETPECSRAAALIISSLNVSVHPCEDFYEFACGGWIAAHPAPPSTGTFDETDALLTQRLQLLLETPAEPSEPAPLFMIRRFYEGCIDTDLMDSLGLTPLWKALGALGGWPMVDDQWDPSSYSTEGSLAAIRDLNFSPMLGMGIDVDIVNTSRNIIYIGEGVTGISEAILADPDSNPVIMSAYNTYIQDSAKQVRDFLGSAVTDEDIAGDTDALINFETKLAQLMSESGPGNVSEVLQLMTVQDLQDIADFPSPGAFDYLVYLRLIFGNTDVIIGPDEPVYLQGGPSYVKGLATLLINTPPRTLANYMAWMGVLDIGSETTYAMRAISDQFIWVYTGGSEPVPRWYLCTMEANFNLGYPVSRAYIDEFFPQEAKAENTEMVEDLRASFDGLLDQNDWLAPADVVTAKEKLAAIEQFVAYPDWIMDDASLTAAYEGLTINADEQFDNLIRIGQFLQYWDCESLRQTPQSTFLYPPTVVNAFYNPQANSITILAGILQIPFYQHNSLAALNYGGIGMVIGHELTHGFDNAGRNFDKDGNLALWWSQESIDAFNARAQCFVDQYDNFHPPEVFDPSVTVNGQLTLGENIADNGGVREAFQAYERYVDRYGEEPRLPGLDEYTPEHLFYLSNANVWCASMTEESILSQLVGDVHSPGRFRVLGPLSNDVEFSRVWGCSAGSPMNRGNESCLLW